MNNILTNPIKEYKINIVLNRNPHLKHEQKTASWAPKTLRMKQYFESKGHEFIQFLDGMYYFDGMPPLKLVQLRMHYDRCVYNDRKNRLSNWSQG